MVAVLTKVVFVVLLAMTGTVTLTVSFAAQVKSPRSQVNSGLVAGVVMQAAVEKRQHFHRNMIEIAAGRQHCAEWMLSMCGDCSLQAATSVTSGSSPERNADSLQRTCGASAGNDTYVLPCNQYFAVCFHPLTYAVLLLLLGATSNE
jgi:hypothetical protein